MAIELTTTQARIIGRLRIRWPDGDLRVHHRPWGLIVEVRDAGRAVALVALDGDGGVHRDRSVGGGLSVAGASGAALAGQDTVALSRAA